jgi:uncharacterized protein with GYD domain
VKKLQFLALMKVLPGRVADQPSFLIKVKSIKPPEGVKIIGAYFLLGRFDGAILFEAPDFKVAKDFIIRIATPQVYKVETLGAISAEEL